MTVNRIAISVLLAAALATLTPHAAGAQGRKGLEGSWVVAIEIADPPPGFPTSFTALESYARGGSLVPSNDNPLVGRPGQGAWDRDGNEFVATILFFVLDGAGTRVGSIRVRHRISVENDAYSGVGQADFLDPAGDVTASLTFTSSGERITP